MSISYLRKIELLRKLPAKDLRRILSISRIKDFAPDSPIFNKFDSADHMFVVIHGRVKIYSSSGSRKRKTFAYLKPGDFFGEMAVLENKKRNASAQAVGQSRLLIIHKRDLKRLLQSDARLSYYLLTTVSQRLRRADEEIENLLFKNILGRVSKAIYDLARQSGARSGEGWLLKLDYTQRELAEIVGTTREPLSRALAALRRAEIVCIRQDGLLISDPKKLEALAYGVVRD